MTYFKRIWFFGLPGVGKTTVLRRICTPHGIKFIELDDFRDLIWRDYLKQENFFEPSSLSFIDAYINSMTSIRDFTDFHLSFSEFLAINIHAYIKALPGEIIVIELSSFWYSAIPPNENAIYLAQSSEVHKRNLRKKLFLGKEESETLYWFLRMAELRLKRNFARFEKINLCDQDQLSKRIKCLQASLL